jgi:hypothetical protein
MDSYPETEQTCPSCGHVNPRKRPGWAVQSETVVSGSVYVTTRRRLPRGHEDEVPNGVMVLGTHGVGRARPACIGRESILAAWKATLRAIPRRPHTVPGRMREPVSLLSLDDLPAVVSHSGIVTCRFDGVFQIVILILRANK